MQLLSQELIEKLACPVCKGNLVSEDSQLFCSQCQLVFSVKDGIPIMLVEEAKKIS